MIKDDPTLETPGYLPWEVLPSLTGRHIPVTFSRHSSLLAFSKSARGGVGLVLPKPPGGPHHSGHGGPSMGLPLSRLYLGAESWAARDGKAGIAGVGARVLVVDDNVDSADSMAMLLSLDGHDVKVAFDGPSALNAAAEFQPQAVLLDIGLPGMDGYEVARRLRKQPGHREVLLVAITGYGQDDDRARSWEAGFDHHLVKPVDPGTLSRVLNHLSGH